MCYTAVNSWVKSKMKPLVLDLFAGAGGFSLGFRLAGCEIIGAIEIDKWAAEPSLTIILILRSSRQIWLQLLRTTSKNCAKIKNPQLCSGALPARDILFARRMPAILNIREIICLNS